MSQSRRLSRIATAVAAGLFTLVCVVPTAAIATSTNAQHSSTQDGNSGGGGGWCC